MDFHSEKMACTLARSPAVLAEIKRLRVGSMGLGQLPFKLWTMVSGEQWQLILFDGRRVNKVRYAVWVVGERSFVAR